MSEIKLPRLLGAAREFNIGQDTLIDFLVGKGFEKGEMQPSAKLSEAMYAALQQAFQGDKVAKEKSNAIDLPKNIQQGEKKRRDEEDLGFRKEERKIADKEIINQLPVVEKVEWKKPEEVMQPLPSPEVKPESVIVETTFVSAEPVVPVFVAPKPLPPVEQELPKVVVVEQPSVELPKAEVAKSIEVSQALEATKPIVVKPTVVMPELVSAPLTIEKPTTKSVKQPVIAPEPDIAVVASKAPEPETEQIIKIEAPELGGPIIKGKIDLSAIDSSTRPKKGIPKKESVKFEQQRPRQDAQPRPQQPQPQFRPQPQQPARPIVPVQTTQTAPQIAPTPVVVIDETPIVPVIENIRAERLEGPKILGKIELPVDSSTRPIHDREKRKRKRIPIDKRGMPSQGQGQPQHTGPTQGGQPVQARHGNGEGGPGQGTSRPVVSTGNRPTGTGQGAPGYNRGGAQGGGGGFSRGPGGPGGNRGPGGPGGGNRGPSSPRTNDRNAPRREDKAIDQKEIQDKLRETQAKLSGSGGRGKSLKAKYRRAKREEAADNMGEAGDDNKLQVTEFISVSELANLMDVSFAEVIGKCMGLGIMVSINQRLDAEVIELVSSEFGFDVEFIGVDDVDDLDDDDVEDGPDDLIARAPIVTIMGHVDHGKTSLLDYIRSANVVAGESGGITQHIGAYEVTTATGKKVTFLDTPGHEAFTAMRARGAKVTDIAVIVIAADDAVMPQTREAISHAQAANLPMIFAINKIDKDGANPQKIYEQLAGMNLLVEEWGGKYQHQEISAKQGLNIELLLEKILLEAELLDLKANPERDGTGTIIEATLDKGRGYVATVLVQNGTLDQGDIVVSGQFFGRVKAMFDERNQKKPAAGPSVPVLILGLNGAPPAGEKFKVFQDEAEAKEYAYKRGQILREQGMRAKKHITLDEIGRRLALGTFKELNIIIKGDVDGSVEALSDSLQKLSIAEIVIKVIHKGVGAITETDVTLANASDAIVIGFNVRPTLQAARLADQESIEIKMYSIIYNAIDEVRSAMEGMLEPKIQEKEVANVEIREVYKFDKATVAGCYVLDGKLKRDAKLRLFRDGVLVFPRQEGAFAELGSLKRFKDDVKEVNNNYECGLTVKNYIDLQTGDTLVAYEEEEVKRTL